MITDWPIPQPGDYPNFDRFVDFHLSENSDLINEQMNDTAEWLSGIGADGSEIRMHLHDAFGNIVHDHRIGCWLVWHDTGIDPWSCLDFARKEIERLNRENASLRDECDAHIDSNSQLRYELEHARDEADYHRQSGRCRHCGDRFGE